MIDNFAAVNGIRSIIDESWSQHGFDCPDYVKTYIVRILADRLDKNPWQPEPSYAERFMTIRTAAEAMILGDTCFFTRSVFPELLSRRGLGPTYFTDLGQGCYEIVLKHSKIPAVKTLSRYFDLCAEMTWTAVHSQGQLREMWQL